MPNIPPIWRKWIYGVSIATVPVLVAAGWLSDDLAPAIVGLLNAIFVGGLALANVPSGLPEAHAHEPQIDELP